MPKGQYDRSSSKWIPPPKAVYPPELVTRVREIYSAGYTLKETAELVGTTVKVLQRLMPRHGIERRKAGPRDQRGALNPQWLGDDADYDAGHYRVSASRGRPHQCAACEYSNSDTTYEWANLTGRFYDPHDYIRLCIGCHRRFDAFRKKGGNLNA